MKTNSMIVILSIWLGLLCCPMTRAVHVTAVRWLAPSLRTETINNCTEVVKCLGARYDLLIARRVCAACLPTIGNVTEHCVELELGPLTDIDFET